MSDKKDSQPSAGSDADPSANKKEIKMTGPAKAVNKDKAGDKGQQAKQKAKSKSASGGSTVSIILALLALLFAALVCAVSVFLYQNLQQLETAAADAANGKDEQVSLIAALNEKMAVNEMRYTDIGRRLDQLNRQQQTLEAMIPEPLSQTIDINEEFALAEIEHLLAIANYRLALNYDVDTALAAMQSADQRLQGLRINGVLQARKQVIADMNSLRSLNQADLVGLGLFLSDLINRVDKLPIKADVLIEQAEYKQATVANNEANIAMQFLGEVWAELKSLVIITRDGQINKSRMLPDETYYLRANIKLELANARFAVFNRDTDNFRASIEQIRGWLNDYFDLADAAVGNVSDSLFRMSKIELAFPDININSSIESVRALARQQAAEMADSSLAEDTEQ